MRIIKDGKLRPVIFRAECGHCACVFEEEKQNLKVEECMREHYRFAHVRCPTCGNAAVMYESKGSE